MRSSALQDLLREGVWHGTAIAEGELGSCETHYDIPDLLVHNAINLYPNSK